MKETEVSWAGNTHRVSCSNSRGVGKCSFSCIFRTVIKEISAKKICSIQKLSGLSCHSFLGDLILRQVFHNRLNDSQTACVRTYQEDASLFCTRKLRAILKKRSCQSPLPESAVPQYPTAQQAEGAPCTTASVPCCVHTKPVAGVPLDDLQRRGLLS